VLLDSRPAPDKRSIRSACAPAERTGTVPVIVPSVQTEIGTVVPPRRSSVVLPEYGPKPAPAKVNDVPMGPDDGVGGARVSGVTVNVLMALKAALLPWMRSTSSG
jgi:hypothetical protein